MQRIPLNFQTMYADLLQSVGLADAVHGSISRRNIKGIEYLYVTTKDGATRHQQSLGPASNAEAQAKAAQIRQAASLAKARRTTVSALKKARIPAPALPLGRVLEAISISGLFDRGLILVGTAAYQTYPCLVGYHLVGSAMMTNDADILVASVVASTEPCDLETILQRADPSFRPHFSRDDKLPKVFKSADDFQVDVLTKFGRGRVSPVRVDGLNCAAEALTFMEYLADEAVSAVVLYGTGIPVRVPPPERYAIHKLLIAQERRGTNPAKRDKDLFQARSLIDAFRASGSSQLDDALEEARARGSSWKKNIDASLKEIARHTRESEGKTSTRKAGRGQDQKPISPAKTPARRRQSTKR